MLSIEEVAKKIKVRYAYTDLPRMKQADYGNWIDMYVPEEVELKKGDVGIIGLGVAMQIPEGYEALVSPRSSTFKNYGLIMNNSIGIIDTAYCGDDDIWGFPYIATRDVTIPKHTRICQFRILESMGKIEFEECFTLGNDNRGGFGSTGK